MPRTVPGSRRCPIAIYYADGEHGDDSGSFDTICRADITGYAEAIVSADEYGLIDRWSSKTASHQISWCRASAAIVAVVMAGLRSEPCCGQSRQLSARDVTARRTHRSPAASGCLRRP